MIIVLLDASWSLSHSVGLKRSTGVHVFVSDCDFLRPACLDLCLPIISSSPQPVKADGSGTSLGLIGHLMDYCHLDACLRGAGSVLNEVAVTHSFCLPSLQAVQQMRSLPSWRSTCGSVWQSTARRPQTTCHRSFYQFLKRKMKRKRSRRG